MLGIASGERCAVIALFGSVCDAVTMSANDMSAILLALVMIVVMW